MPPRITARHAGHDAPGAGDGLRDDRHHHAGARHDRGQRRAAVHAGQPFGLDRPDQLGADLLHRRRRDHDGADRLDGRSFRPQAPVHGLRRRLHLCLAAVRVGAEHHRHGAGPAAARRVRRGAGAAVAIGDARLLSGGATRPGDGDLGHRRDARPDHGADAGRLADRHLQLALGVPDQPAGRHRHRARPPAVHGGDQAAIPHALRLVRIPCARHRHRLAATDARPRRAGRLVRIERDLDRDHRRVRGLLLLLRAFADHRPSRSCASSCSRTATSRPPACSW